MPNMSYCRFRNTRDDLNDCLDALREEKFMSADEANAGRWMFDEFLDYCRENGIISDYDGEMVEAIFHGLTEKEDDDYD